MMIQCRWRAHTPEVDPKRVLFNTRRDPIPVDRALPLRPPPLESAAVARSRAQQALPRPRRPATRRPPMRPLRRCRLQTHSTPVSTRTSDERSVQTWPALARARPHCARRQAMTRRRCHAFLVRQRTRKRPMRCYRSQQDMQTIGQSLRRSFSLSQLRHIGRLPLAIHQRLRTLKDGSPSGLTRQNQEHAVQMVQMQHSP